MTGKTELINQETGGKRLTSFFNDEELILLGMNNVSHLSLFRELTTNEQTCRFLEYNPAKKFQNE